MSDTMTQATKREQLANHGLLDSAGTATDDMEKAASATYSLIALPGESFTYTYGKSPEGDRMLALFGAKTLATNESSQARQKLGKAGTESDQMAWVRERFELIANGTWVDKSREGVSRAWDKDILAGILVESAQAQGKTLDPVVIRARLDSDEALYKGCQQVPEYATEYRKRTNKVVKSVADIMGSL
jgi:hypothetical protein